MSTPNVGPRAARLLLADGRFPAGSYAHSGGLEPTIASGAVRTVADLEQFLTGRLCTSGFLAASFAAFAVRIHRDQPNPHERAARWDELDQEYDSRTPSPTQRKTSRQLGRQLLRAFAAIAPPADLQELGRAPHQPVALGAAHAWLGLGAEDAALASLHECAAGPVSAAVKLLNVDPFQTHAVLARLGPLMDRLTAEAASFSEAAELPASSAPLLDISAERHAREVTRLFAS